MATQNRTRNCRQEGWVELNKRSTPHSWKARWLDWSEARQDSKGRLRPKQKSYLLGAKTAGDLPTKTAARTKWAKIRERVMASSSASSNGAQTFMEYAIGTYMKDRTAIKNWRPASVAKFTYLIGLTASSFGKKQLAAISTAELQSYLNSLAKKAAHHTVNGSLVYIRAIFGFAHEEEVVLKDPSRRLVLPETREPSRPFTPMDQMVRLEKLLQGRDLTILRVFTRCGLRAGEVFGLRVGDLEPDLTLRIGRTFSKGQVGPPKTRASATTVAVPKMLYEELRTLIDALEDKSNVGWLFPSSTKRGAVVMPLRPENWLKRILKPAAKSLGFDITLHSLRRGWGTEASRHGQNMKDIQGQMRHSSMSTTADTYVRQIPESIHKTVETMDELMRRAVEKDEE